MNRLYILERTRDGKRVEFYSEFRNGKQTYIIREMDGKSQDSVTTDLEVVAAFRQRLLRDGYLQVPL